MVDEGQPAIGDLLHRARGDRSKYMVAKATGIAHANVFAIEQGTRIPSVQTLHRLCAFYGLDFDAAVVVAAHDKLQRKGNPN